MKTIECPECGTEISADMCDVCNGTGKVPVKGRRAIKCQECKGKGHTGSYHCSHCWWQQEE